MMLFRQYLLQRMQVCLVPDLEVQTFKIQINMKKKQNLQEPQKQALNIPVVSGSSLNGYHIETLDGTGSFNFFTEAKNSKTALRNMQAKSSDYKRIVKTDRDLTITVKKVY